MSRDPGELSQEFESLPDVLHKISYIEKLLKDDSVKPEVVSGILNSGISSEIQSSKEAVRDVVSSLDRKSGREALVFKGLNKECKSIPEAYEDVLIRGPDTKQNNIEDIVDMYRAKRCLIIGDGKRDISLQELNKKLKGKISSRTRIDINAHGGPIEGVHAMQLGKKVIADSRAVMACISDSSVNPGVTQINCDLWSCHSGAAMSDVGILPKGSVVLAHSQPDDVLTNHGIRHALPKCLESTRRRRADRLTNIFDDLGILASNTVCIGISKGEGEKSYCSIRSIERPVMNSSTIRDYVKYFRDGALQFFNKQTESSNLPAGFIPDKDRLTDIDLTSVEKGKRLLYEALLRREDKKTLEIVRNDDGSCKEVLDSVYSVSYREYGFSPKCFTQTDAASQKLSDADILRVANTMDAKKVGNFFRHCRQDGIKITSEQLDQYIAGLNDPSKISAMIGSGIMDPAAIFSNQEKCLRFMNQLPREEKRDFIVNIYNAYEKDKDHFKIFHAMYSSLDIGDKTTVWKRGGIVPFDIFKSEMKNLGMRIKAAVSKGDKKILVTPGIASSQEIQPKKYKAKVTALVSFVKGKSKNIGIALPPTGPSYTRHGKITQKKERLL